MKCSERIATAYGNGRQLMLRSNSKQKVTDYRLQQYLTFKPEEHQLVMKLQREGFTVHGLHVHLVWRTVYTDEQVSPFKASTTCVIHVRREAFLCGQYGMSYGYTTGDTLSAQPPLVPQWPNNPIIQWLLGNAPGAAGSVDLNDWWRSLTVEFTHHWTIIATAAMLNGTARC